MATIKSFTDVNQSKVLAKILPLESVDMYWFEGMPHIGYSKTSQDFYNKTGYSYIPCWSLSALLSIIPQEIFDGEYIINITEGLDNKWIISYNADNSASFYGLIASADNLVDACVYMVIKLSERKMI